MLLWDWEERSNEQIHGMLQYSFYPGIVAYQKGYRERTIIYPKKGTLLIDAVSLEGKDQVGYVYTTSLVNTGHIIGTSENMISPQ